MDRRGISGRSLVDTAGIKKTRLNEVLAGKKAILVDELDAIARALGTKGSVILARAEDELYGPVEPQRPPFAPDPEFLAQQAALDPGYPPEAEYDQ